MKEGAVLVWNLCGARGTRRHQDFLNLGGHSVPKDDVSRQSHSTCEELHGPDIKECCFGAKL